MKEEVYHMLKIPKYLMMVTGQWDFESQNGASVKLYKRLRYVVLTYWTLLCQMFALSIVMYWNCKVVLIENVFNYLHATINITVTILLNSKPTKRILASIYHHENYVLGKSSEEINRIYSGYVQQNDRIAQFFLCMVIVAAVTWFIVGVRTQYALAEHCYLANGLAFQLWYPFDIQKRIWLGNFVDVSLLSGAITLFLYSKTMPIAMMLYVAAKLKIIQHHIETLDSDVEELRGESCRGEKIRFVLMKHQEAISIMETVQRANSVITIILFYGNVLDLPSYIIQMLFGERYLLPKNCGIFLFSLISVYIFCSVSNSIIIESTKIADVIYEKAEWISYDKRDKCSLALMMLRSQVPLKLEAVTIGVVSLETFQKILKLCYTTTTYFTSVYN